MTAVDASALGALGSGGVISALVVVIFYLLRQNHTDRSQSLAQVSRMHKEHAEEIARMGLRHENQMDEVRSEIVDLKTKISETLALYEAERQAKWEAQDQAAEWRRRAEARTT